MKIGDDQFENVLMLMNIQKMEKRDFFAEIRAQLDLDHYLNDIIIQFKEDQFSYGAILKNLTEEVTLFNWPFAILVALFYSKLRLISLSQNR